MGFSSHLFCRCLPCVAWAQHGLILWLQAQKKKETLGTDASSSHVRDKVRVDIGAYIGEHIGKASPNTLAASNQHKRIAQCRKHQATHSLTLARQTMQAMHKPMHKAHRHTPTPCQSKVMQAKHRTMPTMHSCCVKTTSVAWNQQCKFHVRYRTPPSGR
jgi:hypothetical protein